jgi:hypothetical protein
VLVYWDFHTGSFFAPPPFSGASLVFHHPLCCQCVMMVSCLFFSFVRQFGFGYCSLSQEMISVIHSCPASGSGLLPACYLPSCLFQIVHAKTSSLPLPLSLLHFQCSNPLCCCARLQFAVCYSVFWGMGGG